MKFNNFFVIIITIIIVIIYDHQAVCNKSSANMKRSLMNYLNGLFSPNNHIKLNDYVKRNSKHISQNFRFSQFKPDVKGVPANQPNDEVEQADKPMSVQKTDAHARQLNAKTEQADKPQSGYNASKSLKSGTELDKYDPVKVIEMDWLMISSPLFKDRKMFPLVRIPSGELIYIHTDSNLFRINDAFLSKVNLRPPSSREFWFRLSGLNLYYSALASDINILGAIAIEHILKVDDMAKQSIDNSQIFCFYVIDTTGHNWELCGYKREIVLKFVCNIKNLLGEENADCITPIDPDPIPSPIVTEKIVSQPVIIIPIPSKYCNEDWNYQKQGADWECGCSEGNQQSPIDLPNQSLAIDSPAAPLFMYNTLGADLIDKNEITIEGTIKKEKTEFSYKDNALRIVFHKIGKIITIDGTVYEAQEIVFHTPSEHTIEGKAFDMEVQINHAGIRDIAKQVSLSFLIEKTAGIYNQFFDDLNFFELPNTFNKETELHKQIYVPKIFQEKNSETEQNAFSNMKPFSFYTYQGSITFPPCSENTIVYVASHPIRLGSTAISLFQEALRLPDMKNEMGDIIASDWIPLSNRITQPLNGRPVFFYDHTKYCGPDPVKPKLANEGHFEKILTPINRYFYVGSDKPSGLPHSFVVSKAEATGDTVNEENPNDS